MTFFNTGNEVGSTLAQYRHQADSQEHKILAFFETAERFLYTPSEIRTQVFSNSVPLTSVRRAMSNLTTELVLVKTDQKHAGLYGRRARSVGRADSILAADAPARVFHRRRVRLDRSGEKNLHLFLMGSDD